jgi:superoxide reductase
MTPTNAAEAKTRTRKILKCQDSNCNLVVEVLGGEGEITCCGKPMQVMPEQTTDATKEKHVPWIERVPGGVKVKVGKEQAHPMIDKHWIQWIELVVDGKEYRQYLNPGDAPEAMFPITGGQNLVARELCNIHGLWIGQEVTA